jgi:hypothetical protein
MVRSGIETDVSFASAAELALSGPDFSCSTGDLCSTQNLWTVCRGAYFLCDERGKRQPWQQWQGVRGKGHDSCSGACESDLIEFASNGSQTRPAMVQLELVLI